MAFFSRRTSAASVDVPKNSNTIHIGSSNYIGKILKKGHVRQNWTERHFVIRGCTVSYYVTEQDAKQLKNPKGVYIITAIKDDVPSSLNWIMETTADKPFELKAYNIDDKKRFLLAMNNAIIVHQQRLPTELVTQGIQLKLNEAIELGRSGYIDQCKAELLALIEMNKDNPLLYFHLGTCYLVEGNENLGVSTFKTALQLLTSPTVSLYADVMTNIGLCYYILGNFDEAKTCYNAVLSQFPQDEQAIVNLSIVHMECMEYVEAENLLRNVVNSTVPCPESLLNWADLMNLTNRSQAAIDSLRRLVSIHVTNHIGYFKLGEMYEKGSQIDNAVVAYEKACFLEPHRPVYATALTRVRVILAEVQSRK